MLVAAGVAAAATVAVDQASKAMVRANVEPGEFRPVAFGRQVAVSHVRNEGSVYGIVGKLPTWVPALATGAVGVALLGAGRGSSQSVLAGLGAGLVIGGGLGNVIDRVHQGHVTDWARVTRHLSYFNAADAAVVTGLAVSGVALALRLR